MNHKFLIAYAHIDNDADWMPQALVGVDVGVIGSEAYIIEQNYAPEWRHFENVTRINVSKKNCGGIN